MKIFILGGKSGAELQAGFRVVAGWIGYVRASGRGGRASKNAILLPSWPVTVAVKTDITSVNAATIQVSLAEQVRLLSFMVYNTPL